MKDIFSGSKDIPVMQDETFKILQSTLRWFNASELSPPEMSTVYGAVRRLVESNMVLSDPDQKDYLSLEIVYRNGGAKSWQDKHREWCNVEWWAVLPHGSVIRG